MIKGYLGVDLGTTGTKAILFDENDNVLGKGYQSYKLITPAEKFFEQNAEDWYNAVVNSVKDAVKDFDGEILGMSFSAQGGSFLLADLDENGNLIPLTNALTWLDNRAGVEAQENAEKFNEITGGKLSAGSAISRLFWLKKNMPIEFSKTKLVLSTSDYVYYMLTKKAVIDYTSAAMMAVYDGEKNDWNDKLIEFVGMSRSQFPKVIGAGELIGQASQEFLSATGIKGNLNVYCGVHDQFAASLGSNYFGDDDIIVSTGTTWVVFAKNAQKVAGKFACRRHPDGGYGYFVSAVSSGTVLEWEKNFFGTDYDAINSEVVKRNFDEDLMVYPFISGNGAYRGKNELKFSVHNLTYNHDKFDMLKATMEGVAFEINQIVNTFADAGFNVGKIIVTGGATRSEAWMNILSTVLNRKLYLSEQTDGCCFGAYSVAKKGIEDKFVRFNISGKTVEPNTELAEKYLKKFEKYNQILVK